jgi:hypothetical protein
MTTESPLSWRRLVTLLGLLWGVLEVCTWRVESPPSPRSFPVWEAVTFTGVSLGVPCLLLHLRRRGVVDLARLVVALLLGFYSWTQLINSQFVRATIQRTHSAPGPTGFWDSLQPFDMALLVRFILAAALLGVFLRKQPSKPDPAPPRSAPAA